MQYKKIKCKYCNNEALVPTLRKSNYCNNEECKKKAHNDTSKTSYKNVKYASPKIADNIYTDDIAEIFNAMGNLEYKLILMSQQEKQSADYYTKRNDIFLHKIELENLTQQEKLDIIDTIEKERISRRNNKIRNEIISTFLDGFLIRNPNKFLKKAVICAKENKAIKELKNDEELFRIRS